MVQHSSNIIWVLFLLIIHHLSFRAVLLLIIGFELMVVVQDAFAWFETCDKQISLAAGKTTTVKSPNFKANYTGGSSCRYQIKAPQGFTVTATCSLKIYRVR